MAFIPAIGVALGATAGTAGATLLGAGALVGGGFLAKNYIKQPEIGYLGRLGWGVSPLLLP